MICPLDDLRDFTRVSSDFYPELALDYGQVIDDWYFVRKREILRSTRLDACVIHAMAKTGESKTHVQGWRSDLFG